MTVKQSAFLNSLKRSLETLEIAAFRFIRLSAHRANVLGSKLAILELTDF